MIAPLMRFDIAKEAVRLRAEVEYLDGDRNAKTLVKAGAFRLVLVAFRKGAEFDETDQRGTLALHAIDGRLALRVGQEGMEIAEGEVAVIPAGHPWTAVATTDGLLLIHLAWPPEPGSVGA